MPKDLASRIEHYASAVAESLPVYTDRDEVVELFIRRESIEDDVQQLSPALGDRLQEADRRLAKHRSLLLRRFRAVFQERASDIPRRYWWWYLDEGGPAPHPPNAAAKKG